MKLGELRPPSGSTKTSKRKGRGQGSGLGKTAGRGHKGSGQRSGNKHRPWFEGGQMPLARRLPKRGFSNHYFKKEFQIVNLKDLTDLKVKNINPKVLVSKGKIKSLNKQVKILGVGDIGSPINFKAHAFSQSAREKIEKAGGTIEELC
ncbi:MAG: 50S ribosomal protein L15 [Candidatus Marinimicrobia bacterium]|jgi:large subunit ribosomal protein L15|nr:50S ribosomal protein L15 [Candidatus Neomarinimicrobiota bacterium]